MDMSQIDLIVDQLKRAFDGEAWHGPALLETLEGVDAATAAAHPVADAHSIWELVLHLAGWERVILARIGGKTATLDDKDNFPKPSDVNEGSWQGAIQQLRDTHTELIQAVSNFPEARLKEIAPGRDYDFEFMFLGAVQHAAYHGGQISFLKKTRR
jgi:uncharacterized damage-inducible protein DinB